MTYLQHPHMRRVYALAYSALMTLVLVQPSARPVVGPPAPPGPPTLEREILLTTGHIVAFAVLTVLWTWTFAPGVPLRRALLLAVGIGLTLGLVTELAQSAVPGRGASVLDITANSLATLGTAWLIRLNHKDAKPVKLKAISSEH